MRLQEWFSSLTYLEKAAASAVIDDDIFVQVFLTLLALPRKNNENGECTAAAEYYRYSQEYIQELAISIKTNSICAAKPVIITNLEAKDEKAFDIFERLCRDIYTCVLASNHKNTYDNDSILIDTKIFECHGNTYLIDNLMKLSGNKMFSYNYTPLEIKEFRNKQQQQLIPLVKWITTDMFPVPAYLLLLSQIEISIWEAYHTYCSCPTILPEGINKNDKKILKKRKEESLFTNINSKKSLLEECSDEDLQVLSLSNSVVSKLSAWSYLLTILVDIEEGCGPEIILFSLQNSKKYDVSTWFQHAKESLTAIKASTFPRDYDYKYSHITHADPVYIPALDDVVVDSRRDEKVTAILEQKRKELHDLHLVKGANTHTLKQLKKIEKIGISTGKPENKAVSNEDRAVSNEDRAVSNEDRAVSNEDRAVSSEDRAGSSTSVDEWEWDEVKQKKEEVVTVVEQSRDEKEVQEEQGNKGVEPAASSIIPSVTGITSSTHLIPADPTSTNTIPAPGTSTSHPVPADPATTNNSVPALGTSTSTNPVPADPATTNSIPADPTSTNPVPALGTSTSTPAVPVTITKETKSIKKLAANSNLSPPPTPPTPPTTTAKEPNKTDSNKEKKVVVSTEKKKDQLQAAATPIDSTVTAKVDSTRSWTEVITGKPATAATNPANPDKNPTKTKKIKQLASNASLGNKKVGSPGNPSSQVPGSPSQVPGSTSQVSGSTSQVPGSPSSKKVGSSPVNPTVENIPLMLQKRLTKSIRYFNNKFCGGMRMEGHKLAFTGLYLQISSMVHSLWPHATVRQYGSCVTGLALPTSDVDLVIVFDGYPIVNPHPGPNQHPGPVLNQHPSSMSPLVVMPPMIPAVPPYLFPVQPYVVGGPFMSPFEMGLRYNHNHSPPLDGKYNIQIPLMGPRNEGEIDVEEEIGVDDREVEEVGVDRDEDDRDQDGDRDQNEEEEGVDRDQDEDARDARDQDRDRDEDLGLQHPHPPPPMIPLPSHVPYYYSAPQINPNSFTHLPQPVYGRSLLRTPPSHQEVVNGLFALTGLLYDQPWNKRLHHISTAQIPVIKMLVAANVLLQSPSLQNNIAKFYYNDLRKSTPNSSIPVPTTPVPGTGTMILPVLPFHSVSKIPISVDITIESGEHRGLLTCEYIQKALKCRSNIVSSVIKVMKEVLRQAGLNKPFNGGLSSFPLYLMIIVAYDDLVLLQQDMKQGVKDISEGLLLIHFLKLFGNNFDHLQVGIQVNDTSISPATALFPLSNEQKAALGTSLWVSDPLEPNKNCAKSTFAYSSIKQFFSNMLSEWEVVSKNKSMQYKASKLNQQVSETDDLLSLFMRY